MGDATLAEARAALRGKVAIQGGIPAVALCHGADVESVRDLVTRALRDAEPGDGFVLGMGDNVPPDADFALVRAIAGMVKEYYQSVRA
jgi:uroporphyrinogen-III decarboxylase